MFMNARANPNLLRLGQIILNSDYNPPQTKLMKIAEAQGLPAFNGIDMLVYQGAKSFEIWTDHSTPVDVMRSALEKYLRK